MRTVVICDEYPKENTLILTREDILEPKEIRGGGLCFDGNLIAKRSSGELRDLGIFLPAVPGYEPEIVRDSAGIKSLIYRKKGL